MNVESKVPYGLVFQTKQEREGTSADPNYWLANDAANAAVQVLTLLALLAILGTHCTCFTLHANDAANAARHVRTCLAVLERPHEMLTLRAAPHGRATTLTMRQR